MSAIENFRRDIENLHRYDLFNNYGDPIMEKCDEGDWLRREDVLALLPALPEVVAMSELAPSFAPQKVEPVLKQRPYQVDGLIVVNSF